MFRFSLRQLMLITAVVAAVIGWIGRQQVAAYREAIVAKSMAERRWKEWKSVAKPMTIRQQAAERHARLRYTRDRQTAVQKADNHLIPLDLPPAP